MAKIFLVDLEAVETRYTCQWKTHLPNMLEQLGHDIHLIAGPTDIPKATTPGAFLNFGGTNVYKARQVELLSREFIKGSVTAGDHVIFTDAWHPGIINLKYMSELLGIPVKIHALWHAGSYDPADFLGRLIGDAPWCRHAEVAFFEAIDHNYFASDFHIDMFLHNLLDLGRIADPEIVKEMFDSGKIVRTGWPMEYMSKTLEPFNKIEKKNLILFPHRIAPEKQVEIFRDLKLQIPEYEFLVCQEESLTKDQYHNLLGQAKMVFSANLQETLGISWYEGAVVGAIPLVPDRLSYSEMAHDVFKYPSEWTESWDSYLVHRDDLVAKIRSYIVNYDTYVDRIRQQANFLSDNYFSAKGLLENFG